GLLQENLIAHPFPVDAELQHWTVGHKGFAHAHSCQPRVIGQGAIDFGIEPFAAGDGRQAGEIGAGRGRHAKTQVENVIPNVVNAVLELEDFEEIQQVSAKVDGQAVLRALNFSEVRITLQRSLFLSLFPEQLVDDVGL